MKKTEAEQWAATLTDTSARADDVPDGWHTAEQIAREVKMSGAHTRRQLNIAEQDGHAERRKYRIAPARGLYPVCQWRLKKGWQEN